MGKKGVLSHSGMLSPNGKYIETTGVDYHFAIIRVKTVSGKNCQ